MMHTRKYIYIILSFCCQSLTSPAQNIKLQSPVLAAVLQENNSTTILAAAKPLLGILDASPYKGLDNDRYHVATLHRLVEGNQPDSLSLLLSDGLITYCSDLRISPYISTHISYDELSDKYCAIGEEHLLNTLLTATTVTDLLTAISKEEPEDNSYITLLNELRIQIDSNHTQQQADLSASLAYYRWTSQFKSECIVVNIPSATLRYYKDGKEALKMKVVAGKPSTRTPRFAAYCNEVILYPYWHVPYSIAVNEILPACRKNPDIPNMMNLQVLDKKGRAVNPLSINWKNYSKNNFPYTFRQGTGCSNALGVIKFNVTSPFSVYLHDTNLKSAFKSTKRFYSHGCIRIEKPVELANLLLPERIDDTFIKSCIRGQQPVPKKINPIPLLVVYMLAEPDSAGHVIYYDDIYRLR